MLGHLAALGPQGVELRLGLIDRLVSAADGGAGDRRRHALQQLLQRRLPLLGLQHAALRRSCSRLLDVGLLSQEFLDLLLQVGDLVL